MPGEHNQSELEAVLKRLEESEARAREALTAVSTRVSQLESGQALTTNVIALTANRVIQLESALTRMAESQMRTHEDLTAFARSIDEDISAFAKAASGAIKGLSDSVREIAVHQNALSGTVDRLAGTVDGLATKVDELATLVNRFIRAQGDGHDGGR